MKSFNSITNNFNSKKIYATSYAQYDFEILFFTEKKNTKQA